MSVRFGGLTGSRLGRWVALTLVAAIAVAGMVLANASGGRGASAQSYYEESSLDCGRELPTGWDADKLGGSDAFDVLTAYNDHSDTSYVQSAFLSGTCYANWGGMDVGYNVLMPNGAVLAAKNADELDTSRTDKLQSDSAENPTGAFAAIAKQAGVAGDIVKGASGAPNPNCRDDNGNYLPCRFVARKAADGDYDVLILTHGMKSLDGTTPCANIGASGRWHVSLGSADGSISVKPKSSDDDVSTRGGYKTDGIEYGLYAACDVAMSVDGNNHVSYAIKDGKAPVQSKAIGNGSNAVSFTGLTEGTTYYVQESVVTDQLINDTGYYRDASIHPVTTGIQSGKVAELRPTLTAVSTPIAIQKANSANPDDAKQDPNDTMAGLRFEMRYFPGTQRDASDVGKLNLGHLDAGSTVANETLTSANGDNGITYIRASRKMPLGAIAVRENADQTVQGYELDGRDNGEKTSPWHVAWLTVKDGKLCVTAESRSSGDDEYTRVAPWGTGITKEKNTAAVGLTADTASGKPLAIANRHKSAVIHLDAQRGIDPATTVQGVIEVKTLTDEQVQGINASGKGGLAAGRAIPVPGSPAPVAQSGIANGEPMLVTFSASGLVGGTRYQMSVNAYEIGSDNKLGAAVLAKPITRDVTVDGGAESFGNEQFAIVPDKPWEAGKEYIATAELRRYAKASDAAPENGTVAVLRDVTPGESDNDKSAKVLPISQKSYCRRVVIPDLKATLTATMTSDKAPYAASAKDSVTLSGISPATRYSAEATVSSGLLKEDASGSKGGISGAQGPVSFDIPVSLTFEKDPAWGTISASAVLMLTNIEIGEGDSYMAPVAVCPSSAGTQSFTFSGGGIATKATDAKTGERYGAAASDEEILDEVTFKELPPTASGVDGYTLRTYVYSVGEKDEDGSPKPVILVGGKSNVKSTRLQAGATGAKVSVRINSDAVADSESNAVYLVEKLYRGDVSGEEEPGTQPIAASAMSATEDNTVSFPKASVSASVTGVEGDAGKVAYKSDTSVTDHVIASGLRPNTEYVLRHYMMSSATPSASDADGTSAWSPIRLGDDGYVESKATSDASGSINVDAQIDVSGKLPDGGSQLGFKVEVIGPKDVKVCETRVDAMTVGTLPISVNAGTRLIPDGISEVTDTVTGDFSKLTAGGWSVVPSVSTSDGRDIAVSDVSSSTQEGAVTVKMKVDATGHAGETLVLNEDLRLGTPGNYSRTVTSGRQSLYVPDVDVSLGVTGASGDAAHVADGSKPADLTVTAQCSNVAADADKVQATLELHRAKMSSDGGKVTYAVEGDVMKDAGGAPYRATLDVAQTQPGGKAAVSADFKQVPAPEPGYVVVALSRIESKDASVVYASDSDADDGDIVRYSTLAGTTQDGTTGLRIGPSDGTSQIRSSVSYTGLVPGAKYHVKGQLYRATLAPDADRKVTLGSAVDGAAHDDEFTADQTGSGTLTFAYPTLPADRGGAALCVGEQLMSGDALLSEIRPDADTQWVSYPALTSTVVMDGATTLSDGVATDPTSLITRSMFKEAYGGRFRVKTDLFWADDGKLGEQVTEPAYGKALSATSDDVTSADQLPVQTSIDIPGEVERSGRAIASVSSLYLVNGDSEVFLAKRSSLDEKDHGAVTYPTMSSVLSEQRGDGKAVHTVSPQKGTVTLTDTVRIGNVTDGAEHVVYGTLQLISENGNRNEALTSNGSPMTAVTKFTPEAGKRDYVVTQTFTFDPSQIAGCKVVAYEALMDGNDAVIEHHDDVHDEQQTVYFPSIKGRLTDASTEAHVGVAFGDAEARQTFEYSGLIKGEKYTIDVKLHRRDGEKGAYIDDGAIAGASVTEEFTPDADHGTASVTLPAPAARAGMDVVAELDLSQNGERLAHRFDVSDEEQSISYPDMATKMTDENGSQASVASPSAKLTDKVTYRNLLPGGYTLVGTLHKRDGERDGGDLGVSTTETFEITDSGDGTHDVTYDFDSSRLGGEYVVSFEELRYSDKPVARHDNINDAAQTVSFGSLSTTLVDAGNGTHTGNSVSGARVIDTVSYAGLDTGTEYTLASSLHLKKADGSDGGVVEGAQLEPKKFKPEKPSGTIKVVFTVAGITAADRSLVAFERLSAGDRIIVDHSDIGDLAQTVSFPSMSTKALIDGKKESVAGSRTVIRDVVTYKDLVPHYRYRLEGMLVRKSDSGIIKDADGTEVTAFTEFTPDKKDGSVDVTFTFDSTGFPETEMVVCEDMYAYDEKGKAHSLLTHADVDDAEQTVVLHAAPKASRRDAARRDAGSGASGTRGNGASRDTNRGGGSGGSTDETSPMAQTGGGIGAVVLAGVAAAAGAHAVRRARRDGDMDDGGGE